MKKLTKRQIDTFCKQYPGWKVTPKQTAIYKTFTVPAYIDGLMFVARAAVHAEMANHHPDIQLTYRKVKVKLSTHDAGGVTELDTALAEKIETLG